SPAPFPPAARAAPLSGRTHVELRTFAAFAGATSVAEARSKELPMDSATLGGLRLFLAQRLEDGARESRRDPGHAREVLLARLLDALHRAEARQQGLLLHRSDARDRVQARTQPAALLAVVGDR